MTTSRSPLSALKAQADKVAKILKAIEMAWGTVRATSEAGIAEWILKQMRGSRGPLN